MSIEDVLKCHQRQFEDISDECSRSVADVNAIRTILHRMIGEHRNEIEFMRQAYQNEMRLVKEMMTKYVDEIRKAKEALTAANGAHGEELRKVRLAHSE